LEILGVNIVDILESSFYMYILSTEVYCEESNDTHESKYIKSFPCTAVVLTTSYCCVPST